MIRDSRILGIALRGALVCATVVALSGCAGYRLGDPGELPFHSIHVPPPLNKSLAPQAAALLGTAITREMDRSGRVAIAGENGADARLAVTITSFHREISADRTTDTGLARKWRVTLTATCTLSDVRTHRSYFEQRTVSAFDEVYTDSGQVSAEYENMPVLTGKLAAAIAHEVLAVW